PIDAPSRAQPVTYLRSSSELLANICLSFSGLIPRAAASVDQHPMLPRCPLVNLFPPDRPESQKLRVKRDEKVHMLRDAIFKVTNGRYPGPLGQRPFRSSSILHVLWPGT